MPCPRCGTESRPDEKFCKNCGAALGTAQSAQSAAAAFAGPAVTQPPAQLHPIPEGGLTLEEVAGWLQNGGYSVQVVTGTSGNRHIESYSQGAKFNISTPGCQSGRCASLGLAFAFSCHGKFDVSKLNEWNGKILYCRASYDSENDPWLEMDIGLWPGGTWEALNSHLAIWNNRLGRFIDAFNLR